MPFEVRVLGLDPGLATFGIAVVRILAEGETIEYMEVVKTKKSNAKRRVLVSEDDFTRARAIAVRMSAAAHRYKVAGLCFEAMSRPRNASSAFKVALSFGVIAQLSAENDLPVLQVTPKELKKGVCGNSSASKDEVLLALHKRYPIQLERWLQPMNKGDREHPVDALGAIVTCLDTDMLRSFRQMVRMGAK